MKLQITEGSIFKAFSPEKQEWKADGNYFTPAELQKMDLIEDIIVFTPAEPVLSAD